MILGRRLEDMPGDWLKKYFATQHVWVRILDPLAIPLVDTFPFLKWVPATFSSWKRRTLKVRKGLSEVYSAVVDHAHQQSGKDEANVPAFESLVERLLRENRSPTPSGTKGPALSRRDMAFIAGGVLDGAFDTAYHTSLTLIKAFAAYPDVQKRVQDELDEVWYVPTLQNQDNARNFVHASLIPKGESKWMLITHLSLIGAVALASHRASM